MNNVKKFSVFFCIPLCFILFFSVVCFNADAESNANVPSSVGNVTVDKVWHIKFSRSLNKNTVNSNNISVVDENEQVVPVNLDLVNDNTTVNVSPVKNYVSGEVYDLIIKNVQDTSGKTMPGLKTMKFNTSLNPISSDDIVEYASKFLGIPYFYAGISPETGFDCSGFVQYVYKHFGVNIARDTYGQIKDGTYVDKSKLKPGDLIFFGTYDNPYHVGMYVGNNTFIHSPKTGEVIKISSLDRMDYLCARRIIQTDR